jgi:MYXO-CTERM domain-containing protein
MIRQFTVLALAVVLLGAAHAGAQPHHSFDEMTSSNGYGAITYDLATRRLDGFFEHIYRYPTSDTTNTQTRDFLYDAYFGIRVGTAATWLTEVPLDEAGYVEGTGILRTVQTYRGLRVETFYFAPWGLARPGLALVVRVTNPSGTASGALSLFSIHNLHLGSGRPETGFDGEHISWDAAAGVYTETGPSGAAAACLALTAPSRHACSPNNPWDAVRAGSDLTNTDDSGTVSDAVSGFQWDVGPLSAGAAVARGIVLGLDPAGGAAALAAAVRTFAAGRGEEALLGAEQDGWTSWHFDPPFLAALSPAELAVWRQSVAVLRMAQVREPAPSLGQIVASLPPGQWNISWVRDASYAAVALVRSGHFTEARDALKFMLDAAADGYETYVGRPYRLSVTRYFGNGTEESDWNADGPNIEFDGFGLFLWALEELVTAWDDPWWEPYWTAIREEIAGVLVALQDPATGLIAADSSIWEVHWNGRQKHYAYTSLAAARGLCAAAHLARRLGDTATAAAYESASLAVRDAVVEHLVDAGRSLAQSWEELTAGSGYRDAAVVEALNWGLVRPDGPIGNATLDSFLLHLRPPSGHGFFRNDDGGWYDNQEWVVIDLRAANAFRQNGRSSVADDLIAWITDQAGLNQNLIAELFEATTSNYAGAIPMVGFGAGAYILALADRASATVASPCCGDWPLEPGADADADADVDADGEASDGESDALDLDVDLDLDAADVDADAGTGEGGGGCSCTIPFPSSSGSAILALLFGAAVFGIRRRRG